MLYGPNNQPVEVGDQPAASDLASIVERYAAAHAESSEEMAERAQSLMTIAVMLLGCLPEYDTNAVRDCLARAMALASALGPGARCRLCSCTPVSACCLADGTYCSWAAPFVCSACMPATPAEAAA